MHWPEISGRESLIFAREGNECPPLLILGESNLSRATMAITKTSAQHAAKNIINGKSNQHIINKAFSSLKSAASPGPSAMLMCSATPRPISGRLEDWRETHTTQFLVIYFSLIHLDLHSVGPQRKPTAENVCSRTVSKRSLAK